MQCHSPNVHSLSELEHKQCNVTAPMLEHKQCNVTALTFTHCQSWGASAGRASPWRHPLLDFLWISYQILAKAHLCGIWKTQLKSESHKVRFWPELAKTFLFIRAKVSFQGIFDVSVDPLKASYIWLSKTVYINSLAESDIT